MSVRDDFCSAYYDARMLDAHGFAEWPDIDGLTKKVCDMEDALMVLADALGLAMVKDCRNRWRIVRKSEGGE